MFEHVVNVSRMDSEGIMFYIVKSSLGYFWNEEGEWLTKQEMATQFPTAGKAIRALAAQRNDDGTPVEFVCEISIEMLKN